MVKKIFLWTAPRCISIAFERSIMEVKDTKIFHEPYSKSYHFGPERQSPRYTDKPIDKQVSYDEISKLLTKEYDGIDHLFSKDMAYHVENHFNELLKEDLKSFQHTFLIRSPMKTVISLYKASVNKQYTGWDYFDPDEAGFKQMWELFQFIKENFNQEPVVVDADDLMANPEETMEVQLVYRLMLIWEPGPIHNWGVWNGWHDNLLKSTGFVKQDPERLHICKEKIKDYPNEVLSSIEESLPYYDLLKCYKPDPLIKIIQ